MKQKECKNLSLTSGLKGEESIDFRMSRNSSASTHKVKNVLVMKAKKKINSSALKAQDIVKNHLESGYRPKALVSQKSYNVKKPPI